MSTIALALFMTMFQIEAQSSLSLEPGSYFNRTHVDTVLRRANLNFTYTGCDPNPSAKRIQIQTDGNCKQARDYNLGQGQGAIARSGLLGEVKVSYKEPSQETCESPKTKKLHTNMSLSQIYEKFQSKQCFPTYLVLKDANSGDVKMHLDKRDRGICNLPETRISKANFPTEDHDFFNLTASDKGFKIGDHTQYRFDHDSKNWCVRFRENDEQCGQWPSPLPMVYKNSETNRYHVKGTVSLSPDGQASLRAIDKSYASLKDLHRDQSNGGFTQTDKSKGRIDFRSRRHPNSKVIRTLVSSYKTDEPKATHERSVQFMARNLMGVGITHSWCYIEHCFAHVTRDDLSQVRCNDENPIEMSHGGNGNLCNSCMGITPGLCAVQPKDVKAIGSRLAQDDDFQLLPHGEYKFKKNLEAGLKKNFKRIVTSPRNPGCHEGQAPAAQGLFDPGAATRSVNTVPKSDEKAN